MKNTNQDTIRKSAQNNELYKFFENNKFWESDRIKLKTNYWRGTPSNWSLSFDGHCLRDIFNINDPEFCSKFVQAINGDGQEADKITTLHSSSLASLLIFYSVSENHPIYFDINNGIVEFTKSEFEVKNEVSSGSNNYSNIDVVLYGKDHILYLESKFSEYLTPKSHEVKKVDYYDDIYRRLEEYLAEAQVCLKEDNDGKRKLCKSTRQPIYCEGLKQMISHYLGLKTEIMKGTLNDGNKKIVLGEILFDFGDLVPKCKDRLESYQNAYKQLKDGLQACADQDCPNQMMILNLMTYQSVLGMAENEKFLVNLPETIRMYYRFDGLKKDKTS
jgi:hypothetical protein